MITFFKLKFFPLGIVHITPIALAMFTVILPLILVLATIILHSHSLTIIEVHIRLLDIVASQFILWGLAKRYPA